MNIFKRLFKIFQAKANAMVDNLEDPVNDIEQKLEDLRDELSKNVEYLRKVKALAIRAKNDKDNFITKAKTYEEKAISFLKQAKDSKMDANEAERLAKEVLIKKETLLAKIKATEIEQDRLDYKVELLKGAVGIITSNIAEWEDELKMIKEDLKITQAEQNINEQMGHLDPASIDRRIKFLKEKTAQYQQLETTQVNDIPDDYINLDNDIDFTLDDTVSKANEELKTLKEELGIKNNN